MKEKEKNWEEYLRENADENNMVKLGVAIKGGILAVGQKTEQALTAQQEKFREMVRGMMLKKHGYEICSEVCFGDNGCEATISFNKALKDILKELEK